jgi:hypothetical protein
MADVKKILSSQVGTLRCWRRPSACPRRRAKRQAVEQRRGADRESSPAKLRIVLNQGESTLIKAFKWKKSLNPPPKTPPTVPIFRPQTPEASR